MKAVFIIITTLLFARVGYAQNMLFHESFDSSRSIKKSHADSIFRQHENDDPAEDDQDFTPDDIEYVSLPTNIGEPYHGSIFHKPSGGEPMAAIYLRKIGSRFVS